MDKAKQWILGKKTLLQRVGAVALALGVWQALAMAVGEQLLVPTPLSVAGRLGTIWQEPGFWDTVVQGDGLKYVYTGFLITVIPILVVGTFARLKYKINYFTIMGMIAGTYTDPPALAYANASCSKEAPAVGYSTVYPLCMFLRILTAQLIILLCCA